MTQKPTTQDPQERGLWVVLLLWGLPFLACVAVGIWGLTAHRLWWRIGAAVLTPFGYMLLDALYMAVRDLRNGDGGDS